MSILQKKDITINQRVQNNTGEVIGLKVNNLFNTNVYISEVDSPQGVALSFPEYPYKALAAYKIEDHLIFKGREGEINKIIRLIDLDRITILYGQTGIGKTSLLLAGVIPKLKNILVVHVEDYDDLVNLLIKSLDQVENLSLDQNASLSLDRIIAEVTRQTGKKFILMLDQFERIFQPSLSDRNRIEIAESLNKAWDEVGPQRFRLVVGIRESELGRLEEFREDIPDILQSIHKLKPFEHDTARQAILEPLAMINKTNFISPDLVDGKLLGELDKLSAKSPGAIMPIHLQMVCDYLYREAIENDVEFVNQGFLSTINGGVQGIIAFYKEDLLRKQFLENWRQALAILERIASPGSGSWITKNWLGQFIDLPSDDLQKYLTGLLEHNWLISQPYDGEEKYAFINQTLPQEIRRTASPELKRRFQAEAAIERILDTWLVRNVLATRGQIQYLARYGTHLEPPSILRTILLLRSAVWHREQTNPFLPWLNSQAAWIRYLEISGESKPPGWTSDTEDDLRTLLGLAGQNFKKEDSGIKSRFGVVAISAVNHRDPVTRHTAVLALSALGIDVAIGRVYAAIENLLPNTFTKSIRSGEILAILFDSDADTKENVPRLRISDRIMAGFWRYGNRIIRNRSEIFASFFGGAVGAGLGLGILRIITALFARSLVGVFFALNFFWAAIIGGGAGMGMTLGEIVLRKESQESRPPLSFWRVPIHPDRISSLLAVVFGTFAFGIANFIVAWFNGLGLQQSILFTSMGLFAGFGLSLALNIQYVSKSRTRFVVWIGRLMIAASTFALAQHILQSSDSQPASLPIIFSESFYSANLAWIFERYWAGLLIRIPNFYRIIAVIDAALVGCVLTIGMNIGMRAAQSWQKKWQDLVSRTDT